MPWSPVHCGLTRKEGTPSRPILNASTRTAARGPFYRQETARFCIPTLTARRRPSSPPATPLHLFITPSVSPHALGRRPRVCGRARLRGRCARQCNAARRPTLSCAGTRRCRCSRCCGRRRRRRRRRRRADSLCGLRFAPRHDGAHRRLQKRQRSGHAAAPRPLPHERKHHRRTPASSARALGLVPAQGRVPLRKGLPPSPPQGDVHLVEADAHAPSLGKHSSR